MLPPSTLRLRAFRPDSLADGLTAVQTLAEAQGLPPGRSLGLPTRILKLTLLRSPHVYKTSRDPLEIRTYSRVLRLAPLDRTGMDTFFQTLREGLPPGLSLKLRVGVLSSRRKSPYKEGLSFA